MRSKTDKQLRKILTEVLGLKPGQADDFTADTGLFGHLPELDSMAVVSLITALEEQLGIVVHDDDIDGSTFRDIGTLVDFVAARL